MGGLFSDDVVSVYSNKVCTDIVHEWYFTETSLYFKNSDLWLSADEFGHIYCFKKPLAEFQGKLKLLKTVPVTESMVNQVKDFYEMDNKKKTFCNELESALYKKQESGDVEAVVYSRSFFDSMSDWVHQQPNKTTELFVPSLSICANNHQNRMLIFETTTKETGTITFISNNMANFFKEYTKCYNSTKEIYFIYSK